MWWNEIKCKIAWDVSTKLAKEYKCLAKAKEKKQRKYMYRHKIWVDNELKEKKVVEKEML